MARQLQEILDSGELTGITTPQVDFVPLDVDPAHEEGRMYYGKDGRSHSSLNNVVNTSLNIGQEQWIQVINRTSETILNGKPCRYVDTDAVTGLPTVILAIADSFQNARIGGVATHDIPPNGEGVLTTFGSVGDVDTSGYTLNSRLFLSDTVPGEYVTEPPDIACTVGGPIDISVNGTLFVSIYNFAALPPVIGYLNGGALTQDITVTPQTIANYTSSGSLVSTVDPVAGTINVPTTGIYRISATLNITHADTVNSDGTASIHLVEGTLGTVLSLSFAVGKNQEGTNMSVSIPFSAIAGESYHLEVSSTTPLTTVTIHASSFDIKSEAIR